LNVGGRIGRYFSIVTMLPSLFLTLWVYALFASDAWRSRPDVAELIREFGTWRIDGFAWALLATTVVGLFLHPLQFPTTQLLEGYWGSTALGRGAAQLRIRHYRQRLLDAERRLGLHWEAINTAFGIWYGSGAESLTGKVRDEEMAFFLDSTPTNEVVAHLIARDATGRSKRHFPDERRVMPTRLGNTLRALEDTAGRQYGLKMITTAPHFAHIAPAEHVAYINDAQEQLDTAVRLCSVSLMATVITVPAVLTDGWWLLIALIPYTLAYTAYRAAVSSAAGYAAAMTTVIDIDRFTLYKALGVGTPRDTAEERATNTQLMALLEGDTEVELTYERAATTPKTRNLYRPTRRLRPSTNLPIRQRRAR
jgi:hypothetical protein